MKVTRFLAAVITCIVLVPPMLAALAVYNIASWCEAHK